jgi:hypothetical protein
MRTSALCLAALAAVLLVSPTSAQTTPAAEVTATDGASLLRLDTDAGLVVRGTDDAGAIPAEGAGVRMMWYPGRYAFRAGRVFNDPSTSPNGSTYWNLANVGAGSAAFGSNNRASGTNAFAAGVNAFASGQNAFAFNGAASAYGAVAIGSGAQAVGDDALAMGPSAIAGGLASIVLGPSIANGNFGVAIGLQNSAAGQFSIALGKNARPIHQGSIVISDASASFSSDSLVSARNNDFSLRASGGVRIFSSRSTSAGDPYGPIAGVRLAPGGSSWSTVSDRARKEHFAVVDGEDLLARLRDVPVSTWNYIAQDDGIRHMGPMAQDFRAAFGLGEDSLSINTVDIDGVTLAGVQALDARTVELAQANAALAARVAEVEALRAEVAALQAERAATDTRLARLEAAVVGPAPPAGPVLTSHRE